MPGSGGAFGGPERRRGRAATGIGALVLAGCLATLACDRPGWKVGSSIRAPDPDVAVALGDTYEVQGDELGIDEIPVVQYPRALRPCCAFGANLKVAVGRVPVPGVELGNLVDLAHIGSHRFDNGYLSLQSDDPRGFVDDEHNGLIYTCRGGFIDLAHVRDNADNTLALAFTAARLLEKGGSGEVPPQGAAIRIRLRPVPPAAIARHGRAEIAIALARWVAYQLSVWHEIATYYGYASLAEWPEKISAFSPEDLYSNELGARIASGIVMTRGARSDLEYGVSMDAWLQRALVRLGAVSLEDSQRAMRAVDGAWFDSNRRIPDWKLVMRRNFDIGPRLVPWRLELASPGEHGPVEPLDVCEDGAPPLVLEVEEGFAGALYEDYATVEFEVQDLLADNGFPFPRPGDRVVTEKDFPYIVEQARQATVAEMGPGSDGP